MRLSLLAIFILLQLLARGQDIGYIQTDTLKEDTMKRFQLYGAMSYSGQQFVETMASFANLSVGMTYKNHLDARISYGTILDHFRKQVIFPTTHYYEQKNMGLNLQYSFLEGNIHPVAGCNFQLAWMTWRPEGSSEDLFTDRVYLVAAFAGAAWDIYRSLTLQADIGYSLAKDLELVGLEENDSDGLRYEVTLKFGIFHF